MTAALDRELLARIGTALYGEHWQAPMAFYLGKSPHTVSRWATGKTRGPPIAVWRMLIYELYLKSLALDQLTIDARNAMPSTESDRQISKEKPHDEPDSNLEPAAPIQSSRPR